MRKFTRQRDNQQSSIRETSAEEAPAKKYDERAENSNYWWVENIITPVFYLTRTLNSGTAGSGVSSCFEQLYNEASALHQIKPLTDLDKSVLRFSEVYDPTFNDEKRPLTNSETGNGISTFFIPSLTIYLSRGGYRFYRIPSNRNHFETCSNAASAGMAVTLSS